MKKLTTKALHLADFLTDAVNAKQPTAPKSWGGCLFKLQYHAPLTGGPTPSVSDTLCVQSRRSLAPAFVYNWWAGPEDMSEPLGTATDWQGHTDWQGNTSLPQPIYIHRTLHTFPLFWDGQSRWEVEVGNEIGMEEQMCWLHVLILKIFNIFLLSLHSWFRG